MEYPRDFLFNLNTFRSSDAKRMWRQAIKDRDGNRCVYCGSTENLTIDHIRPKALGGETSDHNCCCACKACNQMKGSMPVDDFLLMTA